MNSRATAPETPRRSERVTALGRACGREGTPTHGFRGRVRARSRRAHSHDGGTDWLRDVILGGQDGLVNILGIVLGVISGGGSRTVLLAAGFAAAITVGVLT